MPEVAGCCCGTVGDARGSSGSLEFLGIVDIAQKVQKDARRKLRRPQNI